MRGFEWYHGNSVNQYTDTQEKYEDSSHWLAFVTKLKDGINGQASGVPQDTDQNPQHLQENLIVSDTVSHSSLKICFYVRNGAVSTKTVE